MLNYSIKNKYLVLLNNLIKEFNLSYHKNLNNKRMMKLDFLKKFKIKLKSLVLNLKKYQNNKFKGMSICKTLDNLTNNFLLIMSSTAFFKTDKLSQEQYHQLKKF